MGSSIPQYNTDRVDRSIKTSSGFWLFEGFVEYRSDCPAFVETMGTDEMPWETESPFTRLLPQFADKPSYFKPDPWHTVNLGTGKSWVASCLVLLLPLFAGNNISVRLEAMSAAYYNFCTTSATRKDSANRLCLSRAAIYIYIYI